MFVPARTVGLVQRRVRAVRDSTAVFKHVDCIAAKNRTLLLSEDVKDGSGMGIVFLETLIVDFSR